MDFKTIDSGERVNYATGATRDTDDNKPRYDLVGFHGLTRLAFLMARGAKKYGERNWEKGQPVSRYLASAFRHLVQYAMGDRVEDHLAAVAFNVFGIMHVEEEAAKGREGFDALLDTDIYEKKEAEITGEILRVMRLSPLVWLSDRDIVARLNNRFGLEAVRQELRHLKSKGIIRYDITARDWALA